MIYDIVDSEELLERLQGINAWIEDNKSSIGNANMYEIMSCMIARNNIRLLEGTNEKLDAEVERMISLRSSSIEEFQEDVPSSKILFDAVRSGLAADSREEMDFICKSESVPFFINNARRRGFDGDITMSQDAQLSHAIPEFKHDNVEEVKFLAENYENASDNVKEVAYEVVNWTINNSVDEIKMNTLINPIETGYGK